MRYYLKRFDVVRDDSHETVYIFRYLFINEMSPLKKYLILFNKLRLINN